MKTIYKYPLDPMFLYPDDQMAIQAPMNAKFLHIHTQGETPQLWAEVDTELPLTAYTIAVVGTGEPIPEGFNQYLGTLHAGSYVWHYYVK